MFIYLQTNGNYKKLKYVLSLVGGKFCSNKYYRYLHRGKYVMFVCIIFARLIIGNDVNAIDID